MINGVFVLILAASILGGFVMIPRAVAHDRMLDEPDRPDYESLADDVDQRHADDSDAWRKGEL